MATWNSQRCFRVVKSHHNQCLCGQYSHQGWLADYKGKRQGQRQVVPDCQATAQQAQRLSFGQSEAARQSEYRSAHGYQQVDSPESCVEVSDCVPDRCYLPPRVGSASRDRRSSRNWQVSEGS
eukprot:7627110-Pyramimonas_sp.AAC.1